MLREVAHKGVEGRRRFACLSYGASPLEECVHQLYYNQYHYNTQCYRWRRTIGGRRKRRREGRGRRRREGGGRRRREGKSKCVQYTIKGHLSLKHGSHVRWCTIVNGSHVRWCTIVNGDPIAGSNAQIVLGLCQLGFQTIHTRDREHELRSIATHLVGGGYDVNITSP